MSKEKWYPRKGQKLTIKRRACPVCNWSGKVIDKKTNLERNCLFCKGTGVIKP